MQENEIQDFIGEFKDVLNKLENKKRDESIIEGIKEAISSLPTPVVNVPKLDTPEITVNVDPPIINVPEEMEVKKPSWFDLSILKEIKSVLLKITEFSLPKKASEAVPVRLSDGQKFYDAIASVVSSGGSSYSPPSFKDQNGANAQANVNSDGNAVVSIADTVEVEVTSSALPTGASTSAKQDTGNSYLGGIAGLVPSAYDYISLSYTGSNLTGVVYKLGGSGGTTVATLTLAYSGSTLTSVTKS